MAFARKVNGYWILEHTVRKDGRFQKKTRYIGKKLPKKTELERIKREFLSGIRRYKYLSNSNFETVEKIREKRKVDIRKLSDSEKKRTNEEFLIRFTYNSSKLSGLDITRRQTYLIIKEGLIPKDLKEMKAVMEVENQKKGFALLTRYKGSLSLPFIKRLHKVLMSGVDDDTAGKTRDELMRDVKIAGTSYVPPKWDILKKEMDNFFLWNTSVGRRLHPLEHAALVHLKVISLQPFADANSRLSRLLMNWVLWKKDYPMINIPIEELEEYYNALDRYQIEKDEKPFIAYIIKKYIGGE